MTDEREFEIDLKGFEQWLRSDKNIAVRTVESYVAIMKTYSKRYDGVFSYYNNREIEEAHLEAESSKATINNYVNTINKYIKYLQSCGVANMDEWLMSNHRIKTVQFLDDILSMADYEFLLKKAVSSKEWAIYLYARIAGTTGMRLCEMLQVKREHLEHGCVDLYGKGSKRRRIYFPKSMREDCLKLLDYLGLESGFVFSPKFKGEKPYGGHGSLIQHKLVAFCEECELPKGLVHAHGFRHFFAKEFIRKNQNIALLADLLGHSNLNTTRIYLKLTSREQAEVVDETVTW